MKNCFVLSLLIASLCSASMRADEAGFAPLFNGKDFDGWDGKPGAWEVKDREIWCTGKSKERNWLIWRKEEPANFILRLEFRWDKGNSGVQVRSDDLGEWQVFGSQVEIASQDKMGLWHHSLLPKEHPSKEVRHFLATAGQYVVISKEGTKTIEQKQEAAKVQSHYKEGEWNTMEIIAKSDTLVQKINGVVFSTLVDRDAKMSRRSGFIALQDHGKGCLVAFRNIRLKKIP